MPRIAPETIEQVTAALNIVDVIGSYFPLRRAGTEFRALCPFHQEKTPSFYVNPGKQTFYCFGCQRGGSVIQFVQEYEHVDFPEAVRRLATRAGIAIQEAELSPEEEEKQTLRKRLLRLHFEAANWFHRNLLRTRAAEAARAYLSQRGLNIETAKRWQIGYAPDSWTAFTEWGQQSGFSREELILSGLVKPKDENNSRSKCYDRFRHRLMFPITNDLGEVIAFSGRQIDPNATGGKYVNSPESTLFSKGSILFGLSQSKRAIARSRQAIVLEGQIDLITSFEAGVENVVAPQGTALTERHAALLKRFAEEIVLFFDADAAGERAAERALEILYGAGLQVRIGVLPAGEDPDSLIRKGGVETFCGLIADAKDFFDFEIERGLRGDGSQSVARRVALARRVAQFAGLVPDPVVRDTMMMRLAQRLKLPRESLDQVGAQYRRSSSGRDPEFDLETKKVGLPEEKVAALCHGALTEKKLLQWIREQPWGAILEPISGTELLQKVLGSTVQPEIPNSMANFLAGLGKAEVAALSQILKRRPIDASVCAEYWTKLAFGELQSRRLRLVGVLRLSEDSADKDFAKSVELREVDDLESLISHAEREWKYAQTERIPGQ
ncbi:MAG TPA: DNA primase, partial [Chthoniobacterales bacterium]|nr:DNA primase [Chthoniobacterales bacterium]